MNLQALLFASTRIAILAAGSLLSAHAQEVAVGKIGPFTIMKVSNRGKFDRCVAVLQPGPVMFRLAWNSAHKYLVSTPAAPREFGGPVLQFDFGRKGTFAVDATTDGKRTVAEISGQIVENLMDVKGKISVDLGSAKFSWPIGNTNMADVFVKVEDCVHQAQGR